MLKDIWIIAFLLFMLFLGVTGLYLIFTNSVEEDDYICKNVANFPSETLECNKKSLEKAKPYQILYLYDQNTIEFKAVYFVKRLPYFFGKPIYSDNVELKYKEAIKTISKDKIEQMREKLLNANQKELDTAKQKEQSEIDRLKNKFENL